MNKRQRQTVEHVIARLKEPHCGASVGGPIDGAEITAAIALLQSQGFEVTSRLYLNTWVIPALELMGSEKGHEQELARRLSGR